MKKRVTEQDSNYDHLEDKSSVELLKIINKEDQSVPKAVEHCIPAIDALCRSIIPKMNSGGRIFYIGAGTSGRLGILDASECPPTFGVTDDYVIGIIAGGDGAIRKAVEFAEDDTEQAWIDLQAYHPTTKDTIIGIAASGRTPYVIGGMRTAQAHGIATGCITCNPDADMLPFADYPIVCVVGPEVVTGSTRMKSGTAQKLILNMISTTVMIKLGRVKGNKMVDMQLSNEKLWQRGTLMLMEALKIEQAEAKALLKQYGSVRAALDARR